MCTKITGQHYAQLSRAQQELLIFCAECGRYVVDSSHVVSSATYRALERKGLVEIFDRPEVVVTEAGMLVGKLLLREKEKSRGR